jgi:hypothetical protein
MSSLPIDVSDLIGRTLTKAMEDQLDAIPNIRIKRAGYIYTADLRTGRLNIHVDDNNVVTHISHG